MDAIETYKHAGLTIEIHVDEGPESPREWDNAGKLVIYSGRGGNFVEVNELDMTFRPDDYSGWDEFEENVLECYPGAEILPVYRYEHSNVAYNTTGFNDRWDSGRVGFILMTKETMLEEYGTGKKIRVSPKMREKARKLMAGEVETYSQWANGEVYGYIIKDENGEDFDDSDFGDSCWGFYGEEYCKQEAESSADSIAEKWFKSAESRAAAKETAAMEAAGQLRLADCG